jgi:hypothetical protein
LLNWEKKKGKQYNTVQRIEFKKKKNNKLIGRPPLSPLECFPAPKEQRKKKKSCVGIVPIGSLRVLHSANRDADGLGFSNAHVLCSTLYCWCFTFNFAPKKNKFSNNNNYYIK